MVASQIVSVPASKVYEAGNRLKLVVLGIVSIIFVAAIVMINLFFRRYIIKPIKNMAVSSSEISLGNLDLEFYYNSKDEIGVFAKSLNRMFQSLKMDLEKIKDKE